MTIYSKSAMTRILAGRSKRHQLLISLTLMMLLVFGASLFGILTRPYGFLAALWPANALLLGLMLRVPRLQHPAGWLLALLAYMAPDLLTGGEPLLAFALALTNLVFVAAGVLLYRLFAPEPPALATPASVLQLLLVCIAAAFFSMLSGMTLVRWCAPEWFASGLWHMAGFWFTSELVNGIVILPMMLTRAERRVSPGRAVGQDRLGHALPALALMVSVLMAVILNGPGSIGIPVPALLWCALHYSTRATVFFTAATSLVLMSTISGDLQGLEQSEASLDVIISARLGIALVALGPLTVACINSARNELLQRFEYLANHDHLTAVLDRGGFFARGQHLLGSANSARAPVAVMVLDIDHFKSVNDRYGHAAGDEVLRRFAQTIDATLRKNDVFGRTGGEEFAVILEGINRDSALGLAERMLSEVARQDTPVAENQTLRVTVSIGLAWHAQAPLNELDSLLAEADRALYRAKAGGRNRVELAELA
ncbi:diguanylate cyclase (GGDEF) domain-containing protein [Halopseudomonas sabulinigri]|uniref:diguanylate cyclase n=1 Tax=Halopseudomonas sabulinigri TaxID=472181 RepID=A0A1H1RZW2_9GAMM|nr:GGDEF domain-containing protein [Halopseudomonas sabulinigri]SDS41297.1 diguanylate cyclase (GGDEF) domain-containing protein [Halopseudomonas sabulinigri]